MILELNRGIENSERRCERNGTGPKRVPYGSS